MNILFVTPYFPYPLNSGGNQAQFHMIDQLRSMARISIVYHAIHGNVEAQLQSLWPDVEFHPYSRRMGVKLREKTENFIHHDVFGAPRSRLHTPNGSLLTPEFLDHLRNVVKTTQPDLMQVDFYPYLYLGFAFPDIPKVFIQHEIEFVQFSRELGQPDRLPDWESYHVIRRRGEEIAAMNAYDAVVALTDVDQAILKANQVTAPLFTSPAAVTAAVTQFNPDKFDFTNQLVFLGGYNHKPNVEGLIWFLERVWPNALRKNPKLELKVVGSWPEFTKQSISSSHPNVEFLGFVQNLETVLCQSIMVVPILAGSGMRMKILEAAQYGAPFVTTTIGVEGLPFQDHIHCEVADDPGEFSDRIVELAGNEARRLELRLHAKELHEQKLSAKALVERRWEIYQQVIRKKPQSV